MTTMFMDEGLDTGDMLLKTVVPITADETGGTLHDKLSAAGAELLIRTLEQMGSGHASENPTDRRDLLRGNFEEIHGRDGLESPGGRSLSARYAV